MLVFLLAAQGPRDDTCRVTVSLVDAESGQPVAGLIRIADESGMVFRPQELLSRGAGLKPEEPISEWSVVPREGATLSFSRSRWALSAISGLETERLEQPLDLAGKETAQVSLRLRRFSRLREQGLVSGNTHVHLMKMTREEADRYLTEVPRADDLDVLFLSYLERAEADREYVSNRYLREDLVRLSKSGTQFANGEEHRHNFEAQSQGYGHVMFLDLKELVLPVSIGPGIMKLGTDGLPIQRGIEQARKQGAAVVWCHNHWGFENVPNWVTRRLDAQNIFDGGQHGSYKDSFYRYLNAGLRVPFSTGTDWFVYDFSRVYVPVSGPISPQAWLESLKAGRSFITNGPLLELTVDGRRPGETIELDQPATVSVRANVGGRVDFGRLELVQNGRVVQTAASHKEAGHFAAAIDETIEVTGPCWLAVRTPPPPVKDDPSLREPVPKNEFGQPLFSHTSPIYVRVAGKDVFDPAAARELLASVEQNREEILRLGKFADEAESERVLIVHDEAIEALKELIAGR